MTSPVWPPAEHQPLLAKIGEMLLDWNGAENGLRVIITAVFERSPASQALTAQLHNVGLCDALRTVSNEFLEEDEQEHIEHLVKYIERVREYRNFYVHGFLNLGQLNGQPAGAITTVSARKKLSIHQQWFVIDDISKVVTMCSEAHQYSAEIHQYIASRKGLLDPSRPPVTTLPRMPPLPDRLEKPRLYPLDEQRLYDERLRSEPEPE